MTEQDKMKASPALSLKTRLAWLTTVAAIGTILDLGSKFWVEDTLPLLPGRSMMLLEPWLEFRLVYNRGTAFSMISDLGDMHLAFGVFAFAISGLMFYWGVRETKLSRLQLVCLGLIVAGAAGNGTQRMLGTGVVDFVVINYPWGGSYPTWNLADAWLVVGTLLLLFLSWFDSNEETTTSNAAAEQDAPEENAPSAPTSAG